MSKEATTTALKEAVKNGDSKEIIFRTGEAKKVYNKEPLTLTGTIDSPSRFLEARPELYEKDRSHCKVSISEGSIELVINEDCPETKKTIKGKIETSQIFRQLGINNPEKNYSPNELANAFKLLRSIFESRAEHMSIVKTLQNLKAKIKQDLDQNNDKRGNISNTFSQTVESNIPDGFNIIIPLIEGEKKRKIELFVTLEATNTNDINCYLESMDAAELIDQEREERVKTEVEKLEGKTTLIYV